MSRLIDADAVILNYEGLVHISPYDFQGIAKYFAEQIAAAPTIDAVPVARCRECIHWVGDFPGATKYVKRCEKKNFTESGKLHTIDKECARRYLEGKIFFGFIIDAFNRIINRINEIEDVINQK